MSAIPQYHEKRISLAELDHQFGEFIGPGMVDVGATLRVMLADYFYGDILQPVQPSVTLHDRTLVFPLTGAPAWTPLELQHAIDVVGEIFWSLAETITHRALMVTPMYTHRPNECMYKFYPETRELVVYTPVLADVNYPGLVALDGRAVITGCVGFLPSWLASAFPTP